jgi:hypothetical protein
MNLPVETVLSLTAVAAEGQTELQRIAREKKAAAAIRLVKSSEKNEAGVELWIVDRVTGKTTYRQLEVKSRYDSGATIDVAVRTVEALRASLLELRMMDHRPTKTAVSPKMTEIAAKTRIRNETELLGIGIGGSGNYSPGGIPVRGAFEIYAVVQPMRGLDVELNISLSPLGKEIRTETENATSTFGYALIRMMVFYRFFHHSIFQPAVGISGGTLIGWVEGRNAEGQTLLQQSKATAYLGGGLRGFLFLKKTLAFVVGAFGGVTLPEVQMVHGAVDAARFGRPLIELSLTLQLRFL